MSTLFEIKQSILDCIDFETGEIIDQEKFDQLKIDKQQKLRNIALLAKNKASDVEQLRQQEQAFAKRRRAAEAILIWCKATLMNELDGRKWEEPEFAISYRTSEYVEIDEGAEIPKKFLKEQAPAIDRVGLKAALKDGLEIDGCRIVKRQNIQIK